MLGSKSRAGWLSIRPAPGSRTEDATPPKDDDGVVRPQAPSAREIPGGPLLARLVILAAVCIFVVVQAIGLVTSPFSSHALTLAVGLSSLVALFAMAVLVTSAAAERWPLRHRLVALAAMALVTYLPIPILGQYWAAMSGFFAGSPLLLLSGWVAWTLFAAAVGGMLVGCVIAVSVLSDLTAYDAAYLTVLTLVIGLVVFGLARLAEVIRYVDTRRGELAQLAVIKERMRFARDLHDLLGYSLSAITLKAELTRRLVASNPGQASNELGEVLDIARQALADVRIVSSGYRNISLAKEASSITSLLTATGINAHVEINCGMLEEKVDTVLATVLREAVTNMLRHSSVRNCTIEAAITGQTIQLLVANDGVPRSARTGRDGGGLENLTTRMKAIGGTLAARVRDDSWFTVLAEAPLTSVATSGPGSDPTDALQGQVQRSQMLYVYDRGGCTALAGSA
jgi:two-component system sensor histidine kinase DesK